MTLDLGRIVVQIQEMVGSVNGDQDRHRFATLREIWDSLDSAEVNRRRLDAKTSFLLPISEPDYRATAPLPDARASYTIAGTDGSYILPDRHNPARYYVINLGAVLISYGDQPTARLGSTPRLFFREDELVVPGDRYRTPINGQTIGPRRAAEELAAAVEALEGAAGPAIALLDGTLILWSLSTLPDAVTDWVLPEFIQALSTLRERGQPVASYVSAPGSAELMNVLRIARCDYPLHGWTINCDHCRDRIMSQGHTPACDVLPQVTDRYLFQEIANLPVGARSRVFRSSSSILDRYVDLGGPDCRICYFYLNAGTEVGRVEVPAWVAEDADLLEMTHAVVYHQAQLGRGYPVVLQEAHEVAVLSTSDRLLIEETIERELARIGIVVRRTGKDGSKRVRFV
jgi:hypothetical protein